MSNVEQWTVSYRDFQICALTGENAEAVLDRGDEVTLHGDARRVYSLNDCSHLVKAEFQFVMLTDRSRNSLRRRLRLCGLCLNRPLFKSSARSLWLTIPLSFAFLLFLPVPSANLIADRAGELSRALREPVQLKGIVVSRRENLFSVSLFTRMDNNYV